MYLKKNTLRKEIHNKQNKDKDFSSVLESVMNQGNSSAYISDACALIKYKEI